jgi:predicted nuclease of restriction endonuclease-like (RecB) superfamily
MLPDVSADEGSLLERVSALIEQARQAVATYTNVALTLTFWRIGHLIDVEVLGQQRADYGQEIYASLGRELATKYGRGYDATNLRRMTQFARLFPNEQIVASLGRELSWTHFKNLLPLKSPEARDYYAQQVSTHRLSVRALQDLIARKGYERREIANTQIGENSAVPLDTFRDPVFLDTLGLHDAYLEVDLETAIVREMETFLLEVGKGFAFVERQKRMIIDNQDYHLDLLFYSRPLHRLLAVELKLGPFRAANYGQMKLYLAWLNKHERQEGEEAPIGLILCPEAGREQIELLEMHKEGIVVAECWTALPPKQELEDRLQMILRNARERLARRNLPLPEEDDA